MYHRPAEWQKGKIIWLAWPYDKSLWRENLVGAQAEFIALVHALSDEDLVILVPDQKEVDHLYQRMHVKDRHRLKTMAYGDIWLRDTLPIYVEDQSSKMALVIPRFNGWGNKYLFKDDLDLSARVADELGGTKVISSVVFEGGAIEANGQGIMLTTEQCLLNANRNPHLNKGDIERELIRCFGAKKIIWLRDGLKNDHTDGHVDTIARFITPQKIAVMNPRSKDDPNYQVLLSIIDQLKRATDEKGDPFELIELPSCGEVTDRSGTVMPASFVNFLIGDNSVVVPNYGTAYDDEAVAILSEHFSQRVVGVNARSILTGGGAFHCISQEFFG